MLIKMIASFLLLLTITQALDIAPCPSTLPSPGWHGWPGTTMITRFYLANDPNEPGRQQTTAFICHRNESLAILFLATDDNIYSPFTNCNQDLYEADVVEVFLTARSSSPNIDLHHYVEMEVSPHGVLFVSHINNPDLTCNGIVGKLVDCGASGIVHKAQISNRGWWAYLDVPFALLDSKTDSGEALPYLKGNFFRIDTPSGSSKEFSCWNSTHSNPPCFHKPLYFGDLYLTGK